ncbi:hypothetical protein J3R83DRAFT_5302 [Lanmaoa asiatica]|nr:hypothetical protein J3R83DRAFT_5302 [Lanmaoa asiatica]
MRDTYSCTFVDCGKAFAKAYELKKHKATHDDPASVFYCPECDFITLQKKNLGIHIAIHTGKKIYECPDMISTVSSSGSPACEARCEYRTNDPAALTKHRKRIHAYIPPPNRRRPTKAKPRQNKDGKASCCKPSRVLRKANGSSSGAGYTTTSIESSEDSSPFLWQGDANAYGQWMDINCSDVSGYDSSISSSATLVVVPEEEMQFHTLYDPSLHSQWVAKYEMGYRTLDMTGKKHLPEPHQAVPPSAPASLDMQTGQGGGLCPEWMVEAGIEGWNQSMLEPYREFYVLDA